MAYKNFRDMFDGGGAGATGDRFEDGPLSGLLNALGIRPAGYGNRAGMGEADAPAGRAPRLRTSARSMSPFAIDIQDTNSYAPPASPYAVDVHDTSRYMPPVSPEGLEMYAPPASPFAVDMHDVPSARPAVDINGMPPMMGVGRDGRPSLRRLSAGWAPAHTEDASTYLDDLQRLFMESGPTKSGPRLRGSNRAYR